QIRLVNLVMRTLVPSLPYDCEDAEDEQSDRNAKQKTSLRREEIDQVQPINSSVRISRVIDVERVPKLHQALATLPPVRKEVDETKPAVQQKQNRRQCRRLLISRDAQTERIK